jgi:hypothetical protein
VNQRQLIIVFGLVGLSLAVIIVLLVTGGAPSGAGFDPVDKEGDVVVDGDESTAPEDGQLADVVRAEVLTDGTGITFEATMTSAIPEDVGKGRLEWRWEVIEGSTTWILSANLDDGPVASILSQRTGYGASTRDGTLPGRVSVDGKTISVRLEKQAIANFPTSFNWTLKTSLDADRTEAASAVATDSAPDSGVGQYPPP